jgi:hypothetical protein
MLELVVKKKLGKNTVTFMVHGDNLFQVLQEAGNLSFGDIDKCGICGSEDLVLGAHIAQKKFKYATVRCNNWKCKATLNFGQQTENPDIFYYTTKEIVGDDGKKKKVLDWTPYVKPENFNE